MSGLEFRQVPCRRATQIAQSQHVSGACNQGKAPDGVGAIAVSTSLMPRRPRIEHHDQFFRATGLVTCIWKSGECASARLAPHVTEDRFGHGLAPMLHWLASGELFRPRD